MSVARRGKSLDLITKYVLNDTKSVASIYALSERYLVVEKAAVLRPQSDEIGHLVNLIGLFARDIDHLKRL